MKRARTSFPKSGSAPATRGFRSGYGSSIREKKTYDNAGSTKQVNTGGSFTLLNVPTLGSDYTNRNGRKIYCKSIYIRGFIRSEPSAVAETDATTGSQQGRMILFIDYQPNGVVPAVTDLLNEASTYSQLNLNNRDRFKILKDSQWVFDPYNVSVTAPVFASTNNQIKNIKCYNFKNWYRLNRYQINTVDLTDTIKKIDELFKGLAVDIVGNEGKGIFYAKNRLGMHDRQQVETRNVENFDFDE